jgi:hypothetical protein
MRGVSCGGTEQPLGDFLEPFERNADPVRTVVRLVADLVGGLLQQEQVDQRLLRGGIDPGV